MIVDHYRFGIHSNIPECCVLEWIATINDHTPKVREGLGYVRCTTCRESNKPPAKVHICTHECEPFLKSIGYSAEEIRLYFPAKETIEL